MKNVYKYGDNLLNEINQTSVGDGAVSFWNLGQEGMVIKGKKDILYIDPYLSDSLEEDQIAPKGLLARDFQPPLEPSKITNASYVLCTHWHQDHMDRATLSPLSKASPHAKFIIPASHVNWVRKFEFDESRLVGAKHLQTIELGEFTVTPIAERHPVDEVDEFGNHYFLGYIIQVNNVTLYHSGDTIYFPELVECLKPFKIEVGFIHINGRDWMRDELGVIGNMNYREAIEFAYTLGIDLLVPTHFDMFASNRENPAYFLDYLFATHRDLKFHLSAVGERFIYHK